MKRLFLVLILVLGMGLAQSLEVGGEVAPHGIRPYLILSWPLQLAPDTYLVPSLFVYPQDLGASWRWGWVSLQLFRDLSFVTVGLEGYWHGASGPAFRLFLRWP